MHLSLPIYDTFETVIDNQFKEDCSRRNAGGSEQPLCLSDTTSEIKATFEELLGSKNGTITIDPSTLKPGNGRRNTESPEATLPAAAATGDALLDWWNGEWYGWWQMTGCSGYYESMEGRCWDVCGVIDIGTDYMGTVTLWDEDYTRAEPMASASVSLNEAGTGEHGTMMSEGGWFTNVALEHADWIVDPGIADRRHDGTGRHYLHRRLV